MAYEVNANGAIAKVRNPWGVLGLSIITIGIYGFFWYYYVNREFKDFGAAMGDQELADSEPGSSVLAVTLGALIIVPAVISFIHTVQREQRVQELAGVEKVNGWLILIVYLVGIGGFVAHPYMQSMLNKAWERYPVIEGGEAPAIPAGAAATSQPAKQPAAQETPPPPPPPAQ